MIIDDVWTEEQLSAFPVAGRCARLVTTRNSSLVTGTAVPVKVDQMSDRQARDLVTSGLPFMGHDAAAALVEVSGRWPLLLRLVNRNLVARGKLSADINAAALELLDELRTGGVLQLADPQSAGGTPLDVADPDQRRRAVRATIEASAGLLDSASRKRLAELGVFAEDENVPVPLTIALWQTAREPGNETGQAATATLLTRLDDLALVSLASSGNGGTWTMHDVIRDFLRDELGERRLRQLHDLVVRAARSALSPPVAASPGVSTGQTAWWELPERARYVRDHLIEHMLAARQSSEAAVLGTDLRWVSARLNDSGPSGAFADLTLVGTPRAQQLARLLGQAAHLLSATAPPHSQVDVLLSRVAHDPDWGPQARAISAARDRPALAPAWPLPDLPEPALRRVIAARSGQVQAIAVSSDGTQITAAGDDVVRTWDAASGQLRATLPGSSGRRGAFAVASDGSWLATTDNRGTVRIQETATGRSRIVHRGRSSWVRAAALTPDGSQTGHRRPSREAADP